VEPVVTHPGLKAQVYVVYVATKTNNNEIGALWLMIELGMCRAGLVSLTNNLLTVTRR